MQYGVKLLVAWHTPNTWQYSNSARSSYTNINTILSCESCYWLWIMQNSDAFYIRDMSICKQSASIAHCCFLTSTYSKSAGSSYTNVKIKKIMKIFLLVFHHANYTRNMSLCKQCASISHFCFLTITYPNSAGSIYRNVENLYHMNLLTVFVSYEILMHSTCETRVSVNRAPVSRSLASSPEHTQT
jgi:hypothetical protein